MKDEEIKKLCDSAINIAIASNSHPYNLISIHLNIFVDDLEERLSIYDRCVKYFKTNYNDEEYPWRFY